MTPAEIESLAKISRFEDLAQLALALCAQTPRSIHLHEPFRPIDCLCLRVELEDRVARAQLLRFGEGPVDHRAVAAGEMDPRAL